MTPDTLTAALAGKILEQIDLTVRLMDRVPDASWRPPIADAWSMGELMGHLLDCLAGFCAALYKARPVRLAHFVELRNLPVNRMCGPAEAMDRVARYRAHIEEGFASLSDGDLGRKLPTVFVPDGESVLTLLLGNLEHLVNHKHQLFMYLKMVPVKVGTPDLYQFRGQ